VVNPVDPEIEIIVPPPLERGSFPGNIQLEIERLRRRCIVELEHVQQFYAWLDGKRLTRQACRVIGESRTGKTVACDAYRLRHYAMHKSVDTPIIPVVYWHSPPEAGPRELFVGILNYLKYQITRGTIAEVRERVYQIVRACGVEMIIIDEAHRLRPKTFSEIRDIFDQLEIAVVLVGTDRLDAVIRRDEQVYNRFMACHRFHRLSTQQLEQVTAVWEAYVLKLPQESNLTSEQMLLVLAKATRGYLGLLDRILREAAILALERGHLKIEYSLLNQVTAEYR